MKKKNRKRTIQLCVLNLISSTAILLNCGCASFLLYGAGLKTVGRPHYDEVRVAENGRMALHTTIPYKYFLYGRDPDDRYTNYCYLVGTPDVVYLNTFIPATNVNNQVKAHWQIFPKHPLSKDVSPDILPDDLKYPARIYANTDEIPYQYKGQAHCLSKDYAIAYPDKERPAWSCALLFLLPATIAFDIATFPVQFIVGMAGAQGL